MTPQPERIALQCPDVVELLRQAFDGLLPVVPLQSLLDRLEQRR